MSGTLPSKTLREIDAEELSQTNPFMKLVRDQRIVEVPELTLESGVTIHNFPIAYKTWGNLNERGDNCLVICHALTGSSDVSDWWGPLLGDNMAFDPSRFLVVCLNSMGSPYGSFSPLSINEETGRPYGPEFPLCTVRDDVKAHKIVLESLGVKGVACVIGGSMGGMLALEWSAMYGEDYVKTVIALATSARHSAWCISWSEAQRQSIYSDPKYGDGFYSLNDPPTSGLSAARMSALLTYRSRNSFEKKFARRTPSAEHSKKVSRPALRKPTTVSEQALQIHNDGHAALRTSHQKRSSVSSSNSTDSARSLSSNTSLSSATGEVKEVKPAQTFFSAQNYLRYQGSKFINRFDANCYIAITRKLDTHDLARDREEFEEDIDVVLQSIEIPALIIGINSDGLFTYSEQEVLAENMPNAHLEKIESPEGHDAFLLEFKLINELMIRFLKEELGAFMAAPPHSWKNNAPIDSQADSVFGEAEEVTNW
ncbi:MET2 (YNL277W) [Zygosaccharomyces parabailii]|nr:MET2 (YNL277W) [Zygosaccharomyces parabailii]CDH13331.1 probable Homoserine O-acetyltransferase [Zygosaccharomyces bailii ISA1307]